MFLRSVSCALLASVVGLAFKTSIVMEHGSEWSIGPRYSGWYNLFAPAWAVHFIIIMSRHIACKE